MNSSRVRAALLLGLIGLPAAASAQPVPNIIQARDGDVIVVGPAERVRVIRRREGQLRAVFDPVARSLLVMLDTGANGMPADGRVDRAYRFEGLAAEWPLGARWQGTAIVEEYSIAGEADGMGVGLITSAGLIQLVKRFAQRDFRNQAAVTVIDYGSEGRSLMSGLPFDIVERHQTGVANARGSEPPDVPAPSSPTATAPVRVGGTIKPPVKTYDVRPVYPQEARAARVTGIVVLEAIIGVDGTVTDTKVVRGVQLLNDAAQTAVRQWRFEPTYLNGAPVPVIVTVTVSFNLQ